MKSFDRGPSIGTRIVDIVAPLVPKKARRAAKKQWNLWRLAYIRKYHAFDAEDLVQCLRSLGVQVGDVVFVHSSYNRFVGFSGGPSDVISALTDVVGGEGTILMPTMPFTGSAVEYVATGQMMDLAKTPSRMGLLSEFFRRMPGVVRSVHPTHPVAALGAHAREIVDGHHLAPTPCGRQSPFGRILDYDGKILLLGTHMRSLSFFHTIEEILEDQLPESPFTEETYDLETRDAQGQLVTTRTRLWDAVVTPRRNPFKLVPVLMGSGNWAEGRVGKLPVIVIRASHILEAARSLADNGIYCYDG